jgi:hypothetical protein
VSCSSPAPMNARELASRRGPPSIPMLSRHLITLAAATALWHNSLSEISGKICCLRGILPTVIWNRRLDRWQNVFCHPHRRGVQQLQQIDPIISATFASSRSMAGLAPSNDPFIGPSPVPDDESAVPREFVPGAAALAPKAPVTDRAIRCRRGQTRPCSKHQCQRKERKALSYRTPCRE